MKVFTADGFTGFNPVGTAAVIVAENEEQALLLLNQELLTRGLYESDSVEDAGIKKIDQRIARVTILNDGDY